MQQITVKLEHCYGIKKLDATFNFATGNAVAIYAPNGAMKSSLAKTFQDIADGVASKDRIFTARTTVRNIKDEAGNDVGAADVLVVQPYDEVMGHSAKTSTLLVGDHRSARRRQRGSGTSVTLVLPAPAYKKYNRGRVEEVRGAFPKHCLHRRPPAPLPLIVEIT